MEAPGGRSQRCRSACAIAWRAVVLDASARPWHSRRHERPLAIAKVVRGLSTLCPPRLFGIGDRRHGQSVDNPASRSAHRSGGESVSMPQGGLRVAKGQFLMALDTDRTSPFSCEVGLNRLRTEHALFRRGRSHQHWMKHRPLHWTPPPGRAGCDSLHGFERGDVCLGGWSPMAAVVGGVLHPLPAAPWVNGERYRGQGKGNPPAACRVPRTHEDGTSPDSKRAGPARPAPNIALFMRGGRPDTWSKVVLWAGPRRAHRKRWQRAMF